jgi:hypothetical protein
MSLDRINKIAGSALKNIEGQEKILLSVFATRVQKALNSFPEDATLTSMAQVLIRMAEKRMFITRAELKDLYRGFYTRNNKFAEVFGEEVGQVELQAPTFSNRAEEIDLASDYASFADPVLANALESAFDNNAPLKMYSAKAAAAAVQKVETLLTDMGFRASASVLEGTPDSILIHASVETPKGRTSFYTVADIQAGKVLNPAVVMNNRGAEAFDAKTLTNYVQTFAGKNLEITAESMISLFKKANDTSTEISNVELAVSKLNASKSASSEYFANGVTGMSVDEATASDVVLPEFKDSEIGSFAEKFDTAAGRAGFKFGERKVTVAARNVVNHLRSFGFAGAQTRIADCNEDSIFFAVSLGKTAFTVPVKMTEKAALPEVLVCNGTVKSFTKEAVNSLLMADERDFKAAAVASPLYSIKASELVETVRSAMADKNLTKAEDALNVLAQSGDEKAHAIALGVYFGNLGATAAKVEETSCSRIIRNASSQHSICSHTGLPLHKVYQDANGDCHPSYRKGMDESYEGGYFMNSKVLL